jgi:hypothetical protein
MNFYNPDCQEKIVNTTDFGLCDDGNRAYIDKNDKSQWIAEVTNKKNIPLIFTVIDNCVIKRNEYPNRGRCDCMLTSDRHIYFVELKDQQRDWIFDAKCQLESTVQFFIDYYDINKYQHKKAFACNKQHSNFHVIDNELSIEFFRKYKVRLDIQAEIIII